MIPGGRLAGFAAMILDHGGRFQPVPLLVPPLPAVTIIDGDVYDDNTDALLATVTGPFNSTSTLFHRQYWGRRPLLWRNAFDAESLMAESSWPTWQAMMDLVYDDDEDLYPKPSCRLIRHIPGQLDSFELQHRDGDGDALPTIEELRQQRAGNESSYTWTILVNDVEHYIPSLADWMDTTFGALVPRWRRDDGQVSCADEGGGIGPHVDNYDVWLIQTTGQREWRLIGNGPLPVEEEDWIPDLDVAVLRQRGSPTNDNKVVVTLQPGDCLYVPPRWVHWGTAVTDECQTLSVGCRSPGAAEMVARVAEQMVQTEVRRYGGYDAKGPERASFPSLTREHKEGMKQLVRDAVEAVLQDESKWDELVGRLATEPVRFLDIHSVESNDLENEQMSPLTILQQLGDCGAVQRTAGISLATSSLHDCGGHIDRFYAMGKAWELGNECLAADLFLKIESGRVITSAELSLLNNTTLAFVGALLEEGILEILQVQD